MAESVDWLAPTFTPDREEVLTVELLFAERARAGPGRGRLACRLGHAGDPPHFIKVLQKLVSVHIQDLAVEAKMSHVSELLWGRALPHESLLIVFWARAGLYSSRLGPGSRELTYESAPRHPNKP